MEKRTIQIDGNIIHCYSDGSVEWNSTYGRGTHLHRKFGNPRANRYLQVKIGGKSYKVHRLIALAFHPNPNNLPMVDHIDRNRQNNKPENLRWVTHKENIVNQSKTRDHYIRK